MRLCRKALVGSNNFKTMRTIFFIKVNQTFDRNSLNKQKEKHKRI